MKMRRFIGAAAAMAVAGTLTVGAAAETYNAYIGFQTAPYSFRNSFDDASYGKDVADGKYFNSVIVWGGNVSRVTWFTLCASTWFTCYQ